METVPAVGSLVEAVGLVMQADLNGVVGEVVSHQDDCAVVNFDSQLKALKPKNLKLVTPAFSAGMMLQAHGLQSRVELNNLVGKVINVQNTDGCTAYTVEFPSHGVILIKAKNTRLPTELPAVDFPVGASVEVFGLLSEVSLNGKVGVVLSHQAGTGLMMVQFPAPHGTMLLKPGNLKKAQNATVDFPVGINVEAHGLQSKIAINGCSGVVVGHRQGPDATTQVIVKFPVHGTMALMSANLKKGAATPTAAPQPTAVAGTFPLNSKVTAHSLVKQTPLNNLTGLVVGHQPGTGQVIVQFPGETGTHALLAKNLVAGGAAPAPVAAPAASPASTFASPTATHDPAVRSALQNIKPPQYPEILCEGWLNKKTPAMGRDYDRRWFSLRGQTLVYYEEKGRISLSAQHECATTSEGFMLSGPGMSRKFELKADKPELNGQWVKALQSASKGSGVLNTLTQLEMLEMGERYQVGSAWLAEYPKVKVKDFIEGMCKEGGMQNGVGSEEVQKVRGEMLEMQKKYEEEKESLQAMMAKVNTELQEARRQVEENTTQAEQVNNEEEKAEVGLLKEEVEKVNAEKTELAGEMEKLREELAAMREKTVQQQMQITELEASAAAASEAAAASAAAAAKVPEPVAEVETAPVAAAPTPAPTPAPVVVEDPVVEEPTPTPTPTPAPVPVVVEETPTPAEPVVVEDVPTPAEPVAQQEPEPTPEPTPAPAVATDGTSAFLLAD